jgi:glycosyltransferase involved in cell wall biosynthesis
LKVFLSGTSLEHSYGGPAYTVARLAAALADEGVEVGLWAPDQTAHASSAADNASISVLSGKVHNAFVTFGRPDIIHDNGIWWRHNHQLATISRRLGIPRVVSPRGMLEPWALQHKGLKKKIAWPLYQSRDLRSASLHHATTEAEASNILRMNLGVPATTIPNGVDMPPEHMLRLAGRTKRAAGEIRTALFVGRIYPVKGLPLLVEAWARVMPGNWRLVIAGPDEAGHMSVVKRAADAAGIGDVVSFPGSVTGREKEELFANADLFILPTLSESFGVAVAEALSFGLPVLTTTGAPWPQLEMNGCGWRVEISADGLARGLRQATALDGNSLVAMGMRGRQLVDKEFRWPAVGARFAEAYEAIRASAG